jgi:outer membrane lipoprotein carrier protein
MRLWTAAALALASLLVAAPEAAGDRASELAGALQRKYDTVRDFSADFVHTYQGGVLRKKLTERGHVLIKKPGKMRWDYAQPEKKLFVSDGAKVYSYFPADKQVQVGTVPRDDQPGAAILFLAGKGNLTRDFTASISEMPAGAPAGSEALKLVPRTAQSDYDWLLLVVDRQSLTLRALVTTDAEGGQSSISFANLQENVNPADKEFAFNIPRGVDVIYESSR